MPSHSASDQVTRRVLTRRGFLLRVGGTTSVLLLTACGGATAPAAPTVAPAKPTDAPKPTQAAASPVASPASSPGAAASPATSASPVAGASPAASPAASPSPAAQAAPAAQTAALPNLRGTTLNILQWSNFVPNADPFFKKQIEDGFMKETGAQVNVEFIDQNTIAPKISAAVQSGSGPDIVMFAHNWPHTYAEGLVDISDVAQDVQRVTGPFFPGFDAYSKVDGRYLGIPSYFLGLAIHYRKSWFDEVGARQFPQTLDEYFAVGKQLKERGRPLGESLGQSIGDPVFFTYPLMWNHGGAEVDQAGRVAVNSPGTIAAVAKMKAAWRDAFDETGTGWDDSGNNRAFLAETISATQNASSIWWVAKDQNVPFFDDIALGLLPAGPQGRATMGQLWTLGVMKYSRNVDAAKAFIRWQMQDAQWMPLFELMNSFICGVGERQNNAAPWDKVPPVTRVLKDTPQNFRGIGWPGPPTQRAGLTQAKYVIVNMFARAVQGATPEAAVAEAEKELKEIYGQA